MIFRERGFGCDARRWEHFRRVTRKMRWKRQTLFTRSSDCKKGNDMSDILSRTAEGFLAGAGSCDPLSSGIDFRLERTSNDDWQIAAVSTRARAWMRDELCCPFAQCCNDVIRADALSANSFVKEAHEKGFRTEFVGRNGKDLF